MIAVVMRPMSLEYRNELTLRRSSAPIATNVVPRSEVEGRGGEDEDDDDNAIILAVTMVSMMILVEK